jgi:hypothetical protein
MNVDEGPRLLTRILRLSTFTGPRPSASGAPFRLRVLFLIERLALPGQRSEKRRAQFAPVLLRVRALRLLLDLFRRLPTTIKNRLVRGETAPIPIVPRKPNFWLWIALAILGQPNSGLRPTSGGRHALSRLDCRISAGFSQPVRWQHLFSIAAVAPSSQETPPRLRPSQVRGAFRSPGVGLPAGFLGAIAGVLPQFFRDCRGPI